MYPASCKNNASIILWPVNIKGNIRTSIIELISQQHAHRRGVLYKSDKMGVFYYSGKKNLLLYWTPRANFRWRACPMARTPIGVLSFESSLPPLAHFLSAENIAERWLTTYYMLVSRLRDLIHVVRWMLNISKMMLKETLQWHSWQRWRIARLLSQNKVFLHQPRPQGLLAFQNGGDPGEDPGDEVVLA